VSAVGKIRSTASVSNFCFLSDYVVQDDLMKAVRKQAEAKKHESGLDYKAV
jgi:hypothetical protein